jgi:hypothetical protein
MGLDHGLRKRHYVKNWNHMKPEERHEFRVLVGGKPDTRIKTDRIEYIDEEVITWRKSNQIHHWFVENVQNGNDDCHNYYVSRDQLKQLLDICKKVIDASELVPGRVSNGYTFNAQTGEKVYSQEAGRIINNPTVAQRLLPTQSGFFFGSTDYDQWYFGDLKETLTVLEKELASGNVRDHYEYWSSW